MTDAADERGLLRYDDPNREAVGLEPIYDETADNQADPPQPAIDQLVGEEYGSTPPAIVVGTPGPVYVLGSGFTLLNPVSRVYVNGEWESAASGVGDGTTKMVFTDTALTAGVKSVTVRNYHNLDPDADYYESNAVTYEVTAPAGDDAEDTGTRSSSSSSRGRKAK